MASHKAWIFLREDFMESNNQIGEQKTGDNSVATPLLVIGLLWLCAILAGVLFCGGTIWLSRQRSSLPALFASPVPTVDIEQQISTDASWKLLLKDEFIGNVNKWSVEKYQSDNVNLVRKIENGRYIWEFQVKTGWRFWEGPDMKSVKDFIVSTEFQHTEGSPSDSYGLFLRNSGSNHYYFEINEKGNFAFYLYYQDEYTTLLEGQKRNVVKPGEINQITIKAAGAHFSIYVNNLPIGEVDNDKLLMGTVGIVLGPSGLPGNTPSSPGQDVRFNTLQTEYASRFEIDNFKLWVSSGDQKTNETDALAPLDPRQGCIVFVSDRDGNREVYTILTDGSDLERLTNNVADDYAPKWSANGGKIVFVSDRDGNPEIYMMNYNGSDITRLTNDPGDDIEPSWSPDGKKIVFSSNRGGSNNLYVLDVNLKTATQLTEGTSEDRSPDWSPDGKVILFQSDRDFGVNLYTVNASSQVISRITYDRSSSIRHPSWSPDGLSYVHEGILSGSSVEIATRNFPNKNYFKVTHSFNSNLWPAWSPDGTQIVFVSNRDGQTDIYIINKTGSAIYQLTNDSAIESEVDWTSE
jgi:hypothetical protein